MMCGGAGGRVYILDMLVLEGVWCVFFSCLRQPMAVGVSQSFVAPHLRQDGNHRPATDDFTDTVRRKKARKK
eukprot:4403380-Amphidinium_carterae.2